MGKNKLPPRGPRNSFATIVRDPKGPYRQKAAKSGDERADQRDPFSRNAKHKVRPHDVTEAFQHGDEVKTKDGKEGMVKNPKAPLGMVGLTVDGEYALIPEDQLELIEESLARMRDLSK